MNFVFLLLARECVKWKGAWGQEQKRDVCGDRWWIGERLVMYSLLS